MNRKFASSLLLLALALAFTACGSSASQNSEAASEILAADVWYLPSAQAGEHVGEEATVGGVVLEYLYVSGKPGRPTLLLYDQAVTIKLTRQEAWSKSPESFSVLIWRVDKKNFPPDFTTLYKGKTLCVTGTIELFNDSPVIIAKDESQIQVGC